MKMKLFSAMAIGVLMGASGMALFGQSERDMHPRISKCHYRSAGSPAN